MGSLVRKILAIKFCIVFIITVGTSSLSVAQSMNALIPDAAVVQHGGSIGYLNVGIGYNLMKEKGTLDLGYGYVPASKGGKLNIVSAKFAYKPFSLKIKDQAVIHPLNPGFFVTYHTGKDFDILLDQEQYTPGYYWWSEAIRSHLSFSNEVRVNGGKILSGSKIKGLSIYSEFNTNELYVVSWFKNPKTVRLNDIFKVGYGIRVHF
jgi:hypothetical protein